MKLNDIIIISIYFLGTVVKSVQSTEADEYYRDAIQIIGTLPSKYKTFEPIFNGDNIENKLYIPQYDSIAQDYEYPAKYVNVSFPKVYEIVLPLLNKAAELDNVDAIVDLADMYMFGNFSIQSNYSRALELYEKAVSIQGNGHAYFMLGFIYSTGLFGEVPIDQAKASLYYQFGMENGDVNAIMALAYRNYHGIGTEANCELSLHYYSHLAHIGMQLLNEEEDLSEDNDIYYNIRTVDFNGGIYGQKVSETPSSIYSSSKTYSSTRDAFNEFLDSYDHPYMEFYLHALEHYDGDYFYDKNLTKAFEIIEDCVELGEAEYGSNGYKSVNTFDSVFLSRCQSLMGHMYLKGQGVEKNYDHAFKWLSNSISIANTSDALKDIGHIYESGLGSNIEPNQNKAIQFYTRAIENEHPSPEAKLNLAKLLIKQCEGQDISTSPNRSEIFLNIQQAVHSGNREALYLYGELLQSNIEPTIFPDKKYSCDRTVIYYKVFVERLERYFLPHLKYAFDELRFGNFKNSLLGYSIAAEQGLENAQVSASNLLYQLQPFISDNKKKTFSQSRVESAVTYLKRASSQNNRDATILLGDIYMNGIESANISVDYDKAFAYFSTAMMYHSSHACYNLAYMYEYGLGPANNSVDYFMAKRYYDLSVKYKEDEEQKTRKSFSKLHVSIALLRLRLKYLFQKKSFKGANVNDGSSGWLNAFKNIGNKNSDSEAKEAIDKINERARAHHEGTENEYEIDEYDMGDYLVIFFTIIFFSFFFIRNILNQFRRIRGVEPNENNQDGNNQQDRNLGFHLNGFLQFEFRRPNFEFHFFAL